MNDDGISSNNDLPIAYTTEEENSPIIERTSNALLWPEKIKSGIDLAEYDGDTDTPYETPGSPARPLTSILEKK